MTTPTYDFSAVTQAIQGLTDALKQPVVEVALAVIGVIVVVILIRYAVNWVRRIGAGR